MPSKGDRIRISNRDHTKTTANGRYGTYLEPKGLTYAWVLLDTDEEEKELRYFLKTNIKVDPMVASRGAADNVTFRAALPVAIGPKTPKTPRPIPSQADTATLELRIQGIGLIIGNAQAELQAVMEELRSMRIRTTPRI